MNRKRTMEDRLRDKNNESVENRKIQFTITELGEALEINGVPF